MSETLRRYKRYPEYKSSGVDWLDEVPASWSMLRMRYVTSSPTKAEIRRANPDTQVSFVPMESIGEYGGIRAETQRTLSECLEGYTYFRDGDVLVAKITPCFENGKGALARELSNGIGFGTTELHILRSLPPHDPRFLFYATISDHFRRMGAASMYGAGGQQRVAEDFIRDLKHPLPPVDEQRAIAQFLDQETARIDALVAKKRRLIELLEERRRRVLTLAVTKGLRPDVAQKDAGNEWLGAIPAHWQILRIGLAVDKITNGFVGPTRDILTPQGVPYLQSLHIKNGGIDFERHPYFVSEEWSRAHSKSVLAEGDVVVVQTGDIGQVASVPPEFAGANCHALIILRLRGRFGSGSFLSLLLQSEYGQNALKWSQTGALHPHLECGHVREIELVLPPLEEQEEIVRSVMTAFGRIDGLIEKTREAMNRLTERRAALISAAVTGKIDVREEVA